MRLIDEVLWDNWDRDVVVLVFNLVVFGKVISVFYCFYSLEELRLNKIDVI